MSISAIPDEIAVSYNLWYNGDSVLHAGEIGKDNTQLFKRYLSFLAILLAAAAICMTADAKTFTTLREVAEVCRTSSGADGTFDFEGRVMLFYRVQANTFWIFTVSDGTNDLVISGINGDSVNFGAYEMPHLNDIFHFKGDFFRYNGTLRARYKSAELVRRGNVGPEAEIAADDVNAPAPRRDVVRLKGIVRDATRDETDPNFIYMTINSNGSIVHVMVHTFDAPSADPSSIIGRNVIVDGRIHTPVNDAHRYSGRYISVSGLANVHIGEDAVALGDAVPDISTIGHIPPQDIARLGRHRAVGTIRAVWGGDRALLETDGGEVVGVKLLGCRPPQRGSRVAVTGFPETDTFFLHLDNAAWTVANGTSLADNDPRDVNIDALTRNTGGMPHIDVKLNGKTIRFTGYVRFKSADGDGKLQVESEGHLVTVDFSSIAEAANDVEPGSKISVTGIYVIDAERATLGKSVPKARGFFIVPRGPDDIAVLSRPSWLTTGRLLFVICLLAIASVVAIVWNAALRILVERQSREVVAAQARKMEAELRIGERTRLAADLHDSLSQNLTVIGYQISAARNTLGEKDPATAEHLHTAAKTILSCRTDLRRCLWDLRNNVLDEPDFSEAIRRTVAPVAGETSVTVHFSGQRSIISDATAHAVLNVVRELVSNAVRHGNAESIQIAGTADGTMVEVSVHDDGCGFDVANRPRQEDGHFGLDGIVERIERIGGAFELESVPGKGTCAKITIIRGRGNT